MTNHDPRTELVPAALDVLLAKLDVAYRHGPTWSAEDTADVLTAQGIAWQEFTVTEFAAWEARLLDELRHRRERVLAAELAVGDRHGTASPAAATAWEQALDNVGVDPVAIVMGDHTGDAWRRYRAILDQPAP